MADEPEERETAGGIAVMGLHLRWLPLAELFDFVEDVLVWVKDREGRYRWVNRAFRINFAMDDRHGRHTINWELARF